MKKLTLLSLTILVVLLSACSAQTPQAVPAQTELSTESKLIVGTFKLDGTDQAITKDQAKQLVILWQVYQEISQSDTAAQEEVDGLLKQIEGTMTDAQMQAINGLSLSQRDVMSLMQEKGLMGNLPQMSNSSSSSSSSGSGSTAGAGGPPDGGGGMMGAGGPPDGGFGGGGFGGGESANRSSSSSSSSSSSTQTRTSPTSQLLNALIEYLQGVAGE
ncbi:MAG: hypothetical protein HYZ25_12330 [Chloroflexi bacterium]|nr:hypothetical protein [Chloroflexota bacterium]